MIILAAKFPGDKKCLNRARAGTNKTEFNLTQLKQTKFYILYVA